MTQPDISVINRAYKYKRDVIELNIPVKFLDKSLKKYTLEDYRSDLRKVRNYDINLLWDKSFWRIGVHESITAIATEPYTKLKNLLKDDTN